MDIGVMQRVKQAEDALMSGIAGIDFTSDFASIVEELRLMQITDIQRDFRLTAKDYAGVLNLGSLYIDDLNDTSGINTGASQFTYDATNKKIRGSNSTVSGIAQASSDGSWSIYNNNYYAQQFICNSTLAGKRFLKCTFDSDGVTGTSPDVTLKLYTSSSDLPGTLIATGTTIKGSDWSSGSSTFYVTSPSGLVDGTKYYLVLSLTSGTSSNYLSIGRYNSGPYSTCKCAFYSGSWTSYGDRSLVFSVSYCDGVASNVIWTPITTPFVPSSGFVTINASGNIHSYLSRDGGTTYSEFDLAQPYNLLDLTSQPSSSNLTLKLVLTDDATIKQGVAWGCR